MSSSRVELFRVSTAIIIGVLMMSSCKTEEELTFSNGKGEPCPGIEKVVYKGQAYHTVLIGSQCWFKTNLNVGILTKEQYQYNNGIIEKHCYNKNNSNCHIYGGLYQWDEMMQYTNQEKAQGICPDGWHIPTDEEWKVLEGKVDSFYAIGDPIWDNEGSRGSDAAMRLKSDTIWSETGELNTGNGSNDFNFSAFPTGIHFVNNNKYEGIGDITLYWTSTERNNNEAMSRTLSDVDKVARYSNTKTHSFSVRCLKDD